MSTMSLNADLFRELSYIADDEESMRKVLGYIRKVVAQRRKAIAGEADSCGEIEGAKLGGF